MRGQRRDSVKTPDQHGGQRRALGATRDDERFERLVEAGEDMRLQRGALSVVVLRLHHLDDAAHGQQSVERSGSKIGVQGHIVERVQQAVKRGAVDSKRAGGVRALGREPRRTGAARQPRANRRAGLDLDRVEARGDSLVLRGTLQNQDDRDRLIAILRSIPVLQGFQIQPQFAAE